MKIHKLPLALGLAGLAWTIFAGIRWAIVYVDYSEAILSVLIGIGMMGSAYLYNWMLDVEYRFKVKDDENRSILNKLLGKELLE